MVGASGRDVDRQVADDPDAARQAVRAQRPPLPLESNLVGDRGSGPPKRAQSALQNAWRAAKASTSAAETGARGSASSPRHPAKAEADR
jgi:hypothetical protein